MNCKRLFESVSLYLPFLLCASIVLLSCDKNNSNNPQVPEVEIPELEVHQDYFASHTYTDTSNCLVCHQDAADHVLLTGHWNWQGIAYNVAGHETELHGKNDMINNFCIAVPSNEGRCSQCHIGYGYASHSFDFGRA